MSNRAFSYKPCLDTLLRSTAVCAIAVLAAVDAAAQPSATLASPRIVAHIDDSVRVTLPGNASAHAGAEYDLGEAPESARLTSASLLLKRTPAQQADLDRFLTELQNPSSPSYRRWLTPDEFGQLYGPNNADIVALVSWLDSEGLTEIAVSKGRSGIRFSGSVGLIEQVFHTSIHSFRRGNVESIANVTAPSIPAALAPVVAGVLDLDTTPAESDLVIGPAGRFDPLARRSVVEHPSAAGLPQPDYTAPFANFSEFLFLTPGDVATMYNTPNKALNANFAGGSSYDGTGVTIGIIGDAPFSTTTDAAIVENWRKLFLPSNYKFNLTVTNVNGASSSNALNEAFLDLETAGGVAPGAAFHFYTSANSILPAITQALDDNAVDIINVSFGKCEKIAGVFNQSILADWQQAAAQGIAVTVSAGDTGSARCDSNGSNEASDGLAVNYYGSTEYNVAVGGTDTWGLVDNFSEYVNSSTSDSAADYYRTVVKPILESTWNDSQASSSETPGPIAKAVVIRDTVNAGGGGPSSCSTQSSAGACLSGYPKPSFQSGPGVPADGVRDLPDVALMSGPGYDYAGWLVCSEDLGDCQENSSGTFSFHAIGGTSAAAPTFAGILALVEQRTGKRLGQSSVSQLYSLARNFGSKVFNDVTLGNNAPPCYAPTPSFPSPNCVKNAEGFYFESGYNTTSGYDLATGLGSVNVTNLVEFWGGSAPASASIVVKPAAATIFRGATLSVTVSVSGSSATPTGTVTLSSGSYKSGNATLSAGKASIVIPANALPAGADTLTASYSGDAKFASSSGTAKVTVTLATPIVTVKPAAATTSRGNILSVAVIIASAEGTPAGSITLTCGSYKSAPATLLAGKATIRIPAGELTAGRDTLTASYAGAEDYTAASGHALITVTKETPKVTVTTAASIAKATALTVTIKVAAASGAITGKVSLASGSYKSAATALVKGSVKIVIPAGKLAVGKDTLTASYSGDTNNNDASDKVTVNVTP